LVATTALADIANKSGYDQLKDALKVTAQQSSEKFDSYTMDFSMVMKDNGKAVTSQNSIQKYDRSKSATENISSGLNMNGSKYNSQVYSDKATQIRVSQDDPTYYVTDFPEGRTEEAFSNPFKEDSAGDIEKIADAVVGSLKDHVVVTENSDGSKGLEGSLTEVQIPSLVNAVASLQLKQLFTSGNQDSTMPRLTKDVFVKEVTGSAKVNKDGVMESILGTAVLSGKDEQGTVHDVTLEILAKLTDVNSTVVTKPDLTGKKVVKNVANENQGSVISNPEKFIGKFSNDILIEKDNKFVKVGERMLDITQMDNKTVTGRYYEVFKPGFEEYATNQRDYKFTAEKPDGENRADFVITTESGTKGSKGNLYPDQSAGKINFNINNSSMAGALYDSTFSPDLE